MFFVASNRFPAPKAVTHHAEEALTHSGNTFGIRMGVDMVAIRHNGLHQPLKLVKN